MRVIGIDPDCQKSGLSVYEGGKLIELHNLTFSELYFFLMKEKTAYVAIEDANQIAGLYAQRRGKNPNVQAAKGESVGKVKQLCRCIADIAVIAGHEVTMYKPVRGNWAEPKFTSMFKRITGWTGKSNSETRSAAFFGHIEMTRRKSLDVGEIHVID